LKNELNNIEEARFIFERDKKILESKSEKEKINELLKFILNQKVIIDSA